MYTPTHTPPHTHTHTHTHSTDPLVCHKCSRMCNKSQIHKYTKLQCKTLQTFYKTVLEIIFTHKTFICTVKALCISYFLKPAFNPNLHILWHNTISSPYRQHPHPPAPYKQGSTFIMTTRPTELSDTRQSLHSCLLLLNCNKLCMLLSVTISFSPVLISV
jgi:hypothetical protein